MLEGLSLHNVRRMFKPGTDLSLVGGKNNNSSKVLIKMKFGARLQQFHYGVLTHPVARCISVLGFSLHLLYAALSIC